MTTPRHRDAGGGWRCTDDGTCCTSPTGSAHHAHRRVDAFIVCSTGEHETLRIDGRPMAAPPTAIGRAHRRSRAPSPDDAEVSAVLKRLRATVANVVLPPPAPAPPSERAIGGRSRPAAGGGDPRDVAAITARVAHIATAARMQSWARRLHDLAAEIEAHAARDDLAVLRRLALRFAAVGARLGT